jgi:enoyl-CoA hydratase/carnithine racemase
MQYTCYDVESKDNIAHIRLGRPDELNTMTPAFLAGTACDELSRVVTGLAQERVNRDFKLRIIPIRRGLS